MRILFMGTPDFAVPSLEALIAAGHTVCGVFSQPDKPVGRHQDSLRPTPVKLCALSHNIPVYQPAKLRDGNALAILWSLAPELIVVAAYGRILPDEILAYPEYGCINVHSSLLPKYRGAAPIHWAVLNGESETGVTIMHMAAELDAGDVIDQITTPIDPNETVETVHDRLAVLGAEQLVKTVAKLEAGTATRTPQDCTEMTLAPMLSRQLSPMDWNRTARELHNQVRGLIPWPAAVTDLCGNRCKVFSTAVIDACSTAPAGTIAAAGKDGIDLVCGDGALLRITELQPDGGKRMTAGAFLAGHPIMVDSQK
ncbi:MAG: methionyl-tRNA formyltransferase [Pseudoflavonifractor sp.]